MEYKYPSIPCCVVNELIYCCQLYLFFVFSPYLMLVHLLGLSQYYVCPDLSVRNVHVIR